MLIFMPPTLEKWGAYWFRLVRPCVRPFVRPFKNNQARGFKFNIWIPGQNIAYPYFFLVKIISPCRVMHLLRAKSEIL